MRGEALLALLQLTDSGFPSGRYTLSHGLETFVQEGLLDTPSTPDTLARLLRDFIRFGVGSSDGVALACAHRAIDPSGAIDVALAARADQRLTAVKLPRETRDASTRTGRALLCAAPVAAGSRLDAYASLVAAGDVPGNHAVVLGLLTGALGVSRLDAVTGELSAYATGWVAAGIRLGLTDHLSAQRVLRSVRTSLVEVAERAVPGNVADISSCTPLPDVMSMRHEQAELRLFSS